jgi:hypothetical protein
LVIREIRKVRKTQQQNPEFGPKLGEIFKKNLLKSTLAFKRWGREAKVKLRKAPFVVVN